MTIEELMKELEGYMKSLDVKIIKVTKSKTTIKDIVAIKVIDTNNGHNKALALEIK